MTIAAVIGAGSLGGSLAYKLAARDRFSQVRLIDPAGGVAAGLALDIQQAAAVERFHSKVTAHDDYGAAAGAAVIILTGPARAPDSGWAEDDAVSILRQVSGINRRAVMVCAGDSHRRVVGRGVTEVGIPRSQLIGTAPYGFQLALQAIVAIELRCSPSQVSLAVLGTPPGHTIVPWSTVTARGLAISHLLDPPLLSRLQAKVPLVWPPGPYTLAAATTRACESIVRGDGLRGLSCFVVLDGELGARGTVAAATVELGTTGVNRVLEPSLSVGERVLLETALRER